MGNYLRFESSLAKSIIELAVLMVAKRWQATFVWNSHRALALDAGLSEGTVEAIRRNQPPQFFDRADEVAYKFLVELLDDRRVSDHTWFDAINEFGDQGVVDLLGVTGYYGMVVMTVIATDLGADLPDAFSLGASVSADTSR